MKIQVAVQSLVAATTFAGAVFGFFVPSGLAQDTSTPRLPAWGTRATKSTNDSGLITVEVQSWPGSGSLPLPEPVPEISAAHLQSGSHRIPLKWHFSNSESEPQVDVPVQAPARLPATIVLETGGKTRQWTGGRIFLAATEARIEGADAKLNSSPTHSFIGGWTNLADSVTWEFKPTRWGMYDVELVCSVEAAAGAELQVDVAGHAFTVRPIAAAVGQFTTVPVGRFYLAKADPFTAKVSVAKLKGGKIMNLAGLTLRPASEGAPIIQSDASIMLHASNAITHSITMRYEPSPQKNCLGFWVNPKDWAEWEFRVSRPGAYQVEVSLGCGKGQGGSDVVVEAAGETLPFVVEDTGDYHVHTVQRVGTVKFTAPGSYSLAVRPLHKKAGAIMDIEKVSLVPVEK